MNGCKTDDFREKRNCMIKQFDDKPRWVDPAEHVRTPGATLHWFTKYGDRREDDSCIVRKSFLVKHNYNFYSNEFATHGDAGPTGASGSSDGSSSHVLCPGIVNVLLFRNPLTRVISHMLWMMGLYETELGPGYVDYFRNRSVAGWRALMPAATDNYYIRSLLGEREFYQPQGSMQLEQLEQAKLVVMQYDVLLTLEAEDLNNITFTYGLGWAYNLHHAHAREGLKVATKVTYQQLLPTERTQLQLWNKLDGQLYRFSAVLHSLDVVMFEVARLHGVPGRPAAEDMAKRRGKSFEYADVVDENNLQCGLLSHVPL